MEQQISEQRKEKVSKEAQQKQQRRGIKVRNFTMDDLIKDVENYKGVKTQYCYNEWEKLTDDKFILNLVRPGLKLEFIDKPPKQLKYPSHCFKTEKEVIQAEIEKLIKKGVIDQRIPVHQEGFLSGIFTRPK